MESLTPRSPNSSASSLGATDQARALLRRAQVLLAALALLVAVAVGVLAAASRAAGLLAGVGTLGACWGLLALAGGIWRAHLAARDNGALAREWARVEPVWSRRRL